MRRPLSKIIITHMHQMYSNELLKLKNMDWFAIRVSLYMHFCVWFLSRISYMNLRYDRLKQ